MYSQRIPTDWANRRCCGDARVVHEIPWSNDIITSNVGFLGDSVVEELGLINYTVFCRVWYRTSVMFSIRDFFLSPYSAISPNLRCSQAEAYFRDVCRIIDKRL